MPGRLRLGAEGRATAGRQQAGHAEAIAAVVDLSQLIAARKADPPKPGTPVSYAGTKTVEAALVAEGLLNKGLADGHFGTATIDAYAAWQRRCDWSGDDADGTPGTASLTKLGKRRGFDVKE
ncbi:hypothetical protein ACIP4S_03950 [Streptomyces chartreusis]|uniref:hypothetical protein n=1 Tax=Streptomyces chartreusis TaxID=1969 RepID=UPI00383042B9